MRFIHICLSIILFQGLVHSQCGTDFRPVNAEISNGIRKNIASTLGMVSYQDLQDNYYFDGNDNDLFYLGYGKSIWVSALDPSGNIKISANTFPTGFSHDFISGPLRNDGTILDSLCGFYNQIWTVSATQILAMRLAFDNGTLEQDDVPENILSWPAQNNVNIPEDLQPESALAPYVDFNNDGLYNPMDGDYPIALDDSPNFMPHQFSFLAFNDAGVHSATNGEGLGMEFHQINYLVDCTEESPSENTVFTRIKYVYKGSENLTDFKLALWEDNDLACNVNDYEGCDTLLNCTYFYNKDGLTWTEECHDPDVPNNNGAIRSTVFFNQTLKAFRHYFLFGVGQPNVLTIDPSGAQEHYNFMNNLWRDGTPITVGGTGFDPLSEDVTQFSYPDIPTDPNGWSMQTADLPVPHDLRALATLINKDIVPGESGFIDFGDYLLYDTERKELEVFEIWPERIEQLKGEFDDMLNGTFSCGVTLEACTTDCVWPGDVNIDGVVTSKDFLVVGVLAGQDINDGVPRETLSSDWFPFNASDWLQSLNGVNAKHGDINGNGVIDGNDLESMETNFRQQNRQVPFFDVLLEQNTTGTQLTTEFEVDSIDNTTATLFDRIVETRIFLQSENSPLLDTPVYGISFDMRFDTNMVTPFIRVDNADNSVFQYSFGHFSDGMRENNLLLGADRIEYAHTNYNAEETTEGGQIILQNLFVREDARTPNPDGRDTLIVQCYNVCATNSLGETIEIGATYDTLFLTNLIVDADVVSSTQEVREDLIISTYPNPTDGIINLNYDRTEKAQIEIYNTQGQLIITQTIKIGLNEVDLSPYNTGLYLIKVNTVNYSQTVPIIKH